MQHEPGSRHNIVLALTPLSANGEGMFLAGRTSFSLSEFTRNHMWLEDLAHIVVQLQESGELGIHVVPVLGLEKGLVNITNYTAFGYMESPFTERYEAWIEARDEARAALAEEQKNGKPEVEEDVHESGLRPDALDGYTESDAG